MPKFWQYRGVVNISASHMTSNLALLRVETGGVESFLGVGGLFHKGKLTNGLLLARGSSLQYAPPGHAPMPVTLHGDRPVPVISSPTQWHVRKLLDGHHQGCVEVKCSPPAASPSSSAPHHQL